MANIFAVLATIMGVIMPFGYFLQAIKIIKNKSAKDVSFPAYAIFLPGTIIWILYGISIKSFPLVIANCVALIGCTFVLVSYSFYKKR